VGDGGPVPSVLGGARVTRIRVVGGPWPQRIGLTGVVVPPPDANAAGRYPWHGRTDDEVIVLLDDDPFNRAHCKRTGDHSFCCRGDDDVWSCAIARDAVVVIG
jgi:hypothetical protein